MNSYEFVQRVQVIAREKPTYRTGGDGSDGTCDCIGLIMGALGGKFDLHSSNYFARCQMYTLDSLLDESQLHEGSVVYKSRRSPDQLHERYQAGGRYYNGDLLDYYHVGVVTSADPLVITHCTSTATVDGIVYDNSIAGWSHFGDLLKVDYSDAEDADAEEAGTVEHDIAIVYTEDGNPAKLRATPSTKLPYIAKVPKGAQVEVLESAAGWATVRWDGLRGYMMDKFLRVIGSVTAEAVQGAADPVTISLQRDVALALLDAFNKGVEN